MLIELVNLGKENKGQVLEAISRKVQEDVENGAMRYARETFALKSSVEKDTMKAQNNIRKLVEESKILFKSKEILNDRIDRLDKTFLKIEIFQSDIKKYATVSGMSELTKKMNLKADNQKTTLMIDRLDRGFTDLSKKVRQEYCSNELLDTKLYRLNEEFEVNSVKRFEYQEDRKKNIERHKELSDHILGCKKALQNHTNHITNVKKDVKNCATQKQLNDLAERTKKFALNKELKDLYDKIVPPVAVM